MSARKPRPVITVVDARPMSESGFRQEQQNVECPKPLPRDTAKSPDTTRASVCGSLPPSQGDRSSVGLVQILPESKPGVKPMKPQQNYTVRYDPHSADAAPNVSGSPTKPPHSVLPENVTTTSTTRPVPRPRPRSMVVSRSEPMCLSAAQNNVKNDKLPAPARPEPATRQTPVTKPCVLQPLAPRGPKGYHVVGSSIWYEGNANANAPRQRPPPVKPKPVTPPPSDEANKTADNARLASATIPSDVGRRKPTIIRPPASSSEGPPASSSEEQTVITSASTVQSETVVTATAASSTTVSAGAQTNGGTKPASHNQQLGSNVLGHVGVSEGAKPQPKKRPTVIKMNKPELCDIVGTGELPSTDHKKNQSLPRSSVEGSGKSPVHDVENGSAAVMDLQRSAAHDSLTVLGRQSVSQESGDHDLKPVPRSQSQQLHSTEQELDRKIPPSKPPPPRASNKVEEQNIAVENLVKDKSFKDKPPRPVSRPNQPPARPSAPPVSHPGEAPELPARPTLGHPLYHYVVQGPHALALFDYTASHPDELSFRAGDVITLESWVCAEWIIGFTEKGHGMFPVNFVEIVEPLPTKPTASSPHNSVEEKRLQNRSATQWMSGPRCVARFDYEATEADDLGFVAGDVIELTERVGDEWLRGKLNGKTGVFPVAFVEIIEHLVTAAAATSSPPPASEKVEQDDGRPYCVATYDFSGETAEDLSFKTGDRISLLKRINEEWLTGSLKGREGMFPAAFVDIVRDIDAELPPRPKVQPTSVPRQPSRDASLPSRSPTGTGPSLISPAAATASVSQSSDVSGSPTHQAVALYDFDGDASLGDLVFRAGERLVDIHTVSAEWMSGRIGDRTGNFPTAFVEIS